MEENKNAPGIGSVLDNSIITYSNLNINLSAGFVKAYRSFLNWEWYKDGNTARLFFHCMLKASHKDINWKGIKIEAGSFLTGRKKLAEELGISEQNVRTAIMHLQSTNDLTIKSTKKYSIITINKWNLYQQINQESINNQPRAIHIQEYKEKNKKFKPPTLEEIKEYCIKRNNNVDPKKFFDYYEASEWTDKNGKPIKSWKQKIITWEGYSTKKNNSKTSEVIENEYAIF